MTLECIISSILRPRLLFRIQLNPLEEFDEFVFKCCFMLKIQTRIEVYQLGIYKIIKI